MALITVPVILAGSALIAASGFFADKAGEGANDAANATLKLAVAAGVGFFVAKKLKVI